KEVSVFSQSRPSEKDFASKKDQLYIFALMGLYILQLLANNPSLWVFVGIGAGCIAFQDLPLPKLHKRVLLVGLGLVTVPLLLSVWAEPSGAVLLTRAQNFFATNFSGGGDGNSYVTLINMIFNSARVVYIIFLAMAAWQGYQDFRQNEEMSSFVRVMAGSLLGVFSVDIVSTFIVPA
ncbi:MAG: hypothetical protein ACRDEA_12710, partial [Microcystaceae cyanobacterium]